MNNMYARRSSENYETTQKLQEFNKNNLSLKTPHLKVKDKDWKKKYKFYTELLSTSGLLSDLDLGVLGNLISTELMLERIQLDLLNEDVSIAYRSKILNSYQRLLSSYNTLCATVGLGAKNRGQILKNQEKKMEEESDPLLSILNKNT
ncbi:hypothetical protein [Paraclostridium sordellii]|uniref:hypothetical protein n=1 Tax=Paraclostridium sordellii TaxID=1505 RepID=UPI0005E2170F|nr:hypothetical protein [Paeniclostridium sordellii]CEN75444.1 Uncharacterised protein [[Clostridium] sordellii] [Paeniclostridium sordellii]CEO25171.1 Uncharacterised protein [[Clostridium] sordellii] [Paeniclostridium sordellii]